jgi:anti-sigma factor (TIGR02949 family)
MSKEIEKIECEKAIKMLLEYLDNELDPHKHEVMDHHLHTCRSCYSRMEFEQKLKHMIKCKDDEDKASEKLKNRIRNITDLF